MGSPSRATLLDSVPHHPSVEKRTSDTPYAQIEELSRPQPTDASSSISPSPIPPSTSAPDHNTEKEACTPCLLRGSFCDLIPLNNDTHCKYCHPNGRTCYFPSGRNLAPPAPPIDTPLDLILLARAAETTVADSLLYCHSQSYRISKPKELSTKRSFIPEPRLTRRRSSEHPVWMPACEDEDTPGIGLGRFGVALRQKKELCETNCGDSKTVLRVWDLFQGKCEVQGKNERLVAMDVLRGAGRNKRRRKKVEQRMGAEKVK